MFVCIYVNTHICIYVCIYSGYAYIFLYLCYCIFIYKCVCFPGLYYISFMFLDYPVVEKNLTAYSTQAPNLAEYLKTIKEALKTIPQESNDDLTFLNIRLNW